MILGRAILWRGLLACALSLTAMAAQAQVACLPIDRVSLRDVGLFSSDQTGAWVAPFEGKCLGLAEFDAILETVTDAYIEAGYILARAYLPEQDLSDRELEIAVVEGRLARIRINGQEQPRWAGQVFPGQIGAPVNLRAVEQGLDVIQEMPRWQAEMSFDSGDAPGDSILDVTAQTPKRTQVKLTSNNQGSEASGQWITGVTVDTGNLLGINDIWEVGLTRTLSPGPLSLTYDGDMSRSGYVQLQLPYGRDMVQLRRSWSDYRATLPGTFNPIPTDGETHSYGLQWKRLSYRDQTVKQHVTFDLDIVSSKNFIQGALIDASSRRLTSAKLSYSHEGPLFGGQITASGSVDMGLKLFGAEDAETQPEGAPDAQYVRALSSVDYERALNVAARQVNWTSTFKAQFSNDRLYGGQQFSIGGVSTVRGSRQTLARGSSGWLWRNEFASGLTQQADPLFGTFEGYLALDMGRVLPQSKLQLTGGSAMGQVVGLRAKNGQIDFDLSYQRIFSTSEGLPKPDGEWMLSLGYTF